MRIRMMGLVLASLLVLSATLPAGIAEDQEKRELALPDEIYFGAEGPTQEENKSEERLGDGSLLSSVRSVSVSVDLLKKGSTQTERSSISFPYERFDWRIDSWYRTSEGLRFFGVHYKDEKVLYDYRAPWVRIGITAYHLTKARCVDGPDLFIYNRAEAFKVWAEYRIEDTGIDVTVEVYCYFFADGEFDPWLDVSSHSREDIQVAQRFDFDLGGASDDNADFFTDDHGWELVTEESNHPDQGNPEDNGYQWMLYDTDQVGSSFFTDQTAKIEPYHSDNSDLYIVLYHSGQLSSHPSAYDNNETTGLYSGASYDPFIGYDLVAWYVSDYGNAIWCNPGPWIRVEV